MAYSADALVSVEPLYTVLADVRALAAMTRSFPTQHSKVTFLSATLLIPVHSGINLLEITTRPGRL
jgi:hypothetical protein